MKFSCLWTSFRFYDVSRFQREAKGKPRRSVRSKETLTCIQSIPLIASNVGKHVWKGILLYSLFGVEYLCFIAGAGSPGTAIRTLKGALQLKLTTSGTD